MRHLTLAVGFGLVVVACATGAVVDPLDLGSGPGGDGSGVDAGSLADVARGTDDAPSYGPPHDAGQAADTATQDTGATDAGVDSGSVVDSAPPPPPPPVGLDCTGKNSSQVTNFFGFPESYDNACDNYFGSGGTAGNPCVPGANDCAALNGQGGYNPFCCYKPASGSRCYADYGGKAQCIPK